MADPATYRPAPGSIPDSPGVYQFRDEHGRVVYVGKAKSLRSRLSSYFGNLAGLHPRTQTMVTTASEVRWTVVATEVEALQLEYSWIKEYDPRFNVRYRDDKSYPSLAVTVGEEYPRLQVMRGPRRRGVRYFGPYAQAWAIRETLDLLLRIFPARTCSTGVFNRARKQNRPCLLGYIDKCSAPCVGRIDAAGHRAVVDDFCNFMAGNTDRYLRRIERDMKAAAAELDFERAARLRDDLAALSKALERNAVVLGDATDADVVAIAEDELEAAVHVFYVRGGRVRGQRGWVVERVEDLDTAGLVGQFLQQLYGPVADSEPVSGETTGEEAGSGSSPVPREVLVGCLPADASAFTEWLSGLRGSRVEIRVPARGDKRALLETVGRNAEQTLTQHKVRRAGDLTTRGQALAELTEALDLESAPLRIECFDVANLSGAQATDMVASMVVFEDGLARRGEYRRFEIRPTGSTLDDTAAIQQAVSRRFRRYLRERADQAAQETASEQPDGHELPGVDPLTGRPRRFAYPPNLLVVDGGPPQVAAAQRALEELGVTDVALVGLAKRMEELWLPDDPDPVILPRNSQGLYLLQRVRDEAHRFANSYHRKKRSASMTVSALDTVPGLGATRRAALVRHFGSVRKLAAASETEIAQVPGVGPKTAAAVVAALTGQPGAPGTGKTGQPEPSTPHRPVGDPSGTAEGLIAFDAATGEVLD